MSTFKDEHDKLVADGMAVMYPGAGGLAEVEPYVRITQTGRWSYTCFMVVSESPGGSVIGIPMIGACWTMRGAQRFAQRMIRRELRRRARRAEAVVTA